MPTRIVVAEDDYLVREAVARVLADSPDFEVVATVADRGTLVATIDERLPGGVVTAIRMPPLLEDEGIRVASLLRVPHPDIGVVVLSQHAEPEYVLKLLDGGSARRAYLLKERVRNRGQLTDAVRAVRDGGSFVDPKIVEVLVDGRARLRNSPLAQLTRREVEILAEIAQGRSNEAIAQSLVLTKRAVEKHIN